MILLLELNSLARKHRVTCLLDLSDEILLLICRYLSPSYILYSFYTPLKPTNRLHRVIFDYYTNIKLDQITNNEYNYLSSLFSHYKTPLRPKSLILSNEHITCLIQRYFMYPYEIPSILSNLRCLKLIDCSPEDLAFIHLSNINISQLQYLHINVKKSDENKSMSKEYIF
jgi:hypothetical protein